ncbi:hypothetical protein [Kribbella sp. CA-247076]|uniref:hypothetical protein n=1 Tax=Kribbella sp. CA-247076 TaxID=3239941 RepID=UPI003D8A00F0
MASSRRPLAAVVAAVAVAAVVGGGLLGAARTPRNQAGAAAAPLAASVSAAPLGLKVPVDATKLTPGREPQVTYLRGRTVTGGVSNPVTVPGTAAIEAAARLWDTTLTVQVTSGTSSSLVIQDHSGKVVQRITGVDSLATSADGKYAAYASGGRFSSGEPGGTVYFQEPGTKPAAVLARPEAFDVRVIAVVDRTVYFSSGRSDGTSWSLYTWDVDQNVVRTTASVASPVSVAARGGLAAGIPVFTDSGLCSAVTDIASGRQRWRTCQYRLDRFSPTSAFVIGLPPHGGSPYGEPRTAALDTKAGKLLREWTGPSLRGAVAEDDDHLLLLWHDRPEPTSRSAVVRCAVSTGRCELATPLSSEPLLLGS